MDRRTAGGDANERAEERVARVADVVESGAAELLRQAPLDEEPRETAHCGGEGRGDGGARHGVRVAVDDQGRAGVEAVPAEPEEEGADELERGGVPIEVPGAFEAADPRAEDLSAHLWRVGETVLWSEIGLRLGLALGLGLGFRSGLGG